MLDFCAKNGVVAETETIPKQEIETTFARIVKNDAKYLLVVGHEVAKECHKLAMGTETPADPEDTGSARLSDRL